MQGLNLLKNITANNQSESSILI